jgi:choline kinase
MTLLDYQIHLYRKHGIDDITVVRGYNAQSIRPSGVRFLQNPEFASSNMVHSLFCASAELKGDVIVSYADIVFNEACLSALLDQQRSEICVVVDSEWRNYFERRFVHPDPHVESLTFDTSQRISDIGGAFPNMDNVQGQYIGLIRLDSHGCDSFRALDHASKHLPEDALWLRDRTYKNSYMTDFLQALVERNVAVHAVLIRNGWLEFDSLEDYERTCEWEKTGALKDLGF